MSNSPGDVLISTALVLLGIVAVVLIVWWIPKRRVRSLVATDPARRVEIENELRKTSIQGAGGAALLCGLVFTWLQFNVARQEAAQGQAARTEELALARRSTIADRFSRAVDQLADQRLTVQLGGVYSLQELAWEDQEYRLVVTSVLSSYIRSALGRPASREEPVRVRVDHSAEESRVAMEALLVVSGLNPWKVPERLPYIEVVEAHSIDMGPRAIARSRLYFANIDLSGQNIAGLDLRGAVLEGANLREANMIGDDLTGAMLLEADLSWAIAKKAVFRGADLRNVTFENADLGDADLSSALIGYRGYYFGLDSANLRGANLGGLNLAMSDLDEWNLEGACGDEQTKLPEGVGELIPCPDW